MNLFFDSSVNWFPNLFIYFLKSTLILGTGYLVVMVWKTLAAKEKYRLLSWTLIIAAVIPAIAFILPEWNPLPVGLREPMAGQISNVINLIPSSGATVFASGVSLLAIVQVVWIAGIFGILLRVLIGQVATRRIIRAGIQMEDDTLVDLARSMGVDARVKLVCSSRASVPFTFGLNRPVIVVPDRLDNWTEPQKRMIFLHELAHIARKDAPVHTLMIVLNSVYWFNPGVWFLLRTARQLSEEACDEMVISRGVKPSDYADYLLNVLQAIKSHRGWGLSGATMTTKSFKHMGGRIMKILTNRPISKSSRSIRIAWVVSMLICSVFLLGSFQADAGEKPEPAKPNKTKENLPSPDEFIKLTKAPELLTETPLEYPKEAKKKGVQGEVWIRALILKDGSVQKTEIAKSSDHKVLDESALKAGMLNKYKPGYQEDKPVACWVTYKVSFVLKE